MSLTHALLAGDSAAVRANADESGGERAAAAHAFAFILDSDFDSAVRIAEGAPRPDDDGCAFELEAVLLLARAMAGVSGVDVEAACRRFDAAGPALAVLSPWGACLLGESGMSVGRLDLAEHVATSLLSILPATDPHGVFAAQTAARALLFQGRLPDACTRGTATLPFAERHRLTSLHLVLRGTLAYIAALRDDGPEVEACIDEVESLADSCPPSYFVTGAFVLSAYALAAAGHGSRAARLLLMGGGGADLPRLQSLDRTYGYELLVTAALTTGDLVQAREWGSRAARIPAFGSEMVDAARHRITARLAVAEGDHKTSAALAELAAELADGTSGYLDATRARLIAGSALLYDNDPAAAQARLSDAGVDATQMGAVSLSMLARRDLRSIGLRFTGADQTPMSNREREVAELIIAGHSNSDIARALNVSERTVHSHVAGVLRALGVPSRAALARVIAPPPAGDTAGQLTTRQQEVAELVSRGYTNEGISRELGLSVKTVEKHLGDAFRRLGVESRAALASLWTGRSTAVES